MSPRLRQMSLVAGLLATLGAAYLAPSADVVGVQTRSGKPVARVVSSNDSARTDRTTAARVTVLAIRPRDSGDEAPPRSGELFASRAEPVKTTAADLPAVPARVQEVASLPEIPPVPFRVLGGYADEVQTGVFIEYQDQSLIGRVGDVVAGLYRIETIQGSTLVVTYLPLDRHQTVDIAAAPAR